MNTISCSLVESAPLKEPNKSYFTLGAQQNLQQSNLSSFLKGERIQCVFHKAYVSVTLSSAEERIETVGSATKGLLKMAVVIVASHEPPQLELTYIK